MTLSGFFNSHQDLVQLIFYAIIITSLWVAEALVSGAGPRPKWRHTLTNIWFIFTALPIQLSLTTIVVAVSAWATTNHWGLIYHLPFHTIKWYYYLVLFVLLDLGEYCYHVIMHKHDLLWRFHLVHHSDLEVDVSTTIREHPCETAIRTCFLILWVFLLGPSIGVLILRQVFQSASNILAHTEFRLPERLNRIVGFVLITPNLHHVHHHYQLPYTDCNYGDVLSIWDHLFGTYGKLDKPQTVFGLDTHMDKAQNGKFRSIILMPFQKIVRPGVDKLNGEDHAADSNQ